MDEIGFRLVFLACVAVFCCCAFGDTHGDVNLQQKLINRIEVLEIQGKEQALMQSESMATMEAQLEEQSQKLQRQDETIREYKHRLRQLETTVAQLQSAAESRPERAEDSGEVSDLASQHESQIVQSKFGIGTTTDKDKRKRALISSEAPVAFHAVIKQYGEARGHIGITQKIVFPDVMVNSGGGYHNLHGVFIAPRPGYYIFSASIMSYRHGHPVIMVHLMKNGQVLANAYAYCDDPDCHDQGSVTVVTRLAVGDEVWVELYSPPDTSLWGDLFDTFMGCLVIPE